MSTVIIQVVRQLLLGQALAGLSWGQEDVSNASHLAVFIDFARACMSAASIQVVCQLLLGQALVQGHWHIHPKGICCSKVRRQVAVVQCMLHAHEAIGLPIG